MDAARLIGALRTNACTCAIEKGSQRKEDVERAVFLVDIGHPFHQCGEVSLAWPRDEHLARARHGCMLRMLELGLGLNNGNVQ